MPRTQVSIQRGRGASLAPLTPSALARIVRRAIGQDWQITVRLVGKAEARELNERFRQRDYAPNVLTFPYPEVRMADIVICTPIVRIQAREQGKSFAAHLSHMVVHGALHSVGYDHQKPRQAQRMEKLEREILAEFGVADPYEG